MERPSHPNSDGQQKFGADAPDAGPDRRRGKRYRSVCRLARIRRADDVGLWRVRNISDEGMMLAAHVDMVVGEDITVELSENISLNGKIAWVDDGRCGVVFSKKIDAAATLTALAKEQAAERHRALRIPVEITALVALRDGARPIYLVNLSQHGAGFRCDSPLDPGTEVDLLLPGEEDLHHALVRWSQGLRGGLWFTQPLDRADLETIARFRPRN